MTSFMTATTILTTVSTLLLLLLGGIYGRSFVRMRSMFTLGLLLFVVLFLIQNAVALYFYVTMMPYFASGLEMYAFTFALVQTLAFAVLAKLAWK